jgi:ubiquitin carboxyl-terminal hydrolase 10
MISFPSLCSPLIPVLFCNQRDHIHTVQDALTHISHPQSVQVTHPSRPGVVLEASQQVLIEALPNILVLHMKRFCYDTNVGGVVKVAKQVRFGPELEVGNGGFFFPFLVPSL